MPWRRRSTCAGPTRSAGSFSSALRWRPARAAAGLRAGRCSPRQRSPCSMSDRLTRSSCAMDRRRCWSMRAWTRRPPRRSRATMCCSSTPCSSPIGTKTTGEGCPTCSRPSRWTGSSWHGAPRPASRPSFSICCRAHAPSSRRVTASLSAATPAMSYGRARRWRGRRTQTRSCSTSRTRGRRDHTACCSPGTRRSTRSWRTPTRWARSTS